jgi:hypothetical protein
MCSTATIFNRGEDRVSLKTLVNLASFCQNLGFGKDYIPLNWIYVGASLCAYVECR